jgi:DNA (cytosine-5)-methyltransferase 1
VRAKGGTTRFGNLIPEFERCVAEAAPSWFLMENVPAAPVPVVDGYAVRDFVVCNSHIAGGDGFGQEQMRKRRFSFGLRGAEAAPDLRRWIKPAALLLPTASAVCGGHSDPPSPEWCAERRERLRQTTVVGGGATRAPSVRSGAGLQPTADFLRERQPTITGAHQCSHRPNGGRGERRTLAEMCRLQGLPEDFLADAPFTVDGKRKAIANGVPLPLGRAIAQAVAAALDLPT